MLSSSEYQTNVFESFNQWFLENRRELDALVFDVDGVWVLDNRPLPGSLELLNELRHHNIPFSLLTNDANHSIMEKSRSLRKCGLEIEPEEIASCGDGLTAYVADHRLQGKRFFAMGDLGNPCYGEKAGLLITRRLQAMPACEGVIVGEDHYDWETVINGVVNHFIQYPEHPMVVPNPDEFYPKEAGKIQIAAGGVARFILRVLDAYGISLNPVFLGKPYAPIFQYNHSRLEERSGKTIDPYRVLMIGDHLGSDILGANRFGYRSALLLGGLTQKEHVEKSHVAPELFFRGL